MITRKNGVRVIVVVVGCVIIFGLFCLRTEKKSFAAIVPNTLKEVNPTKMERHITSLTDTKPLEHSENLTIITAFFNIGKFPKGASTAVRTPDQYRNWMKVLGVILNPIVFYLETDDDVAFIKEVRRNLDPGLTKIVQLNRTTMWAFGLRDKISQIYNQSWYPKHHPNTVVPEYSCAMHAKYEVTQATVEDNPFMTEYFAWMDIGYFRDLQKPKPFKLALPPNFDPEKVAYSERFNMTEREARHIFMRNHIWLCGGFFVAKGNTMLVWVKEYMQATEHFLNHRLMNTDQQILYAMFMKDNFNFRPKTKLQPYKKDGQFNAWFHLGYKCRQQGEKLASS